MKKNTPQVSLFRLRIKQLIAPVFAFFFSQLPLHVLGQVSFSGNYLQNFDGMGTGSTIPSGWSHSGKLGGSSTSWTNQVPSSGNPSAASQGVVNNRLILGTNSFSGSSNTQAYNYSDANSSNRALGTSPSNGAGNILQLILSNNTGSSLNTLQMSYQIRRFANAASAETLPGYLLFVSVNGGSTWLAVPAMNPTSSTVPNSVGVSSFATTITLPSAVASGGQIRFRWVDDNSASSEPDQRIGLDNVSISIVQPPAPACAIPSGLLASNIGTSSASLSWQPAQGALQYNLNWKPSSASAFTTVSGLNTTSFQLAGLQENTFYDFQVQSVCSSGPGSYSPVFTFRTAAINPVCTAANNLNATNINATSAMLSWTTGPGVDYHIIYWKPVGAANYNSQNNLQTHNWLLGGLSPGTNYVFQVQAICGGFVDEPAINAELSAPFYFTTSNSLREALVINPESVEKKDFQIWPNPNQGEVLYLKLDKLDATVINASVELLDLSGRVLLTNSFPVKDGVLNGQLQLPGTLAGGIYSIRLRAGEEQIIRRLCIR